METGELPKSRTTIPRRTLLGGGLAAGALAILNTLGFGNPPKPQAENRDEPIKPVPTPQIPKTKPVATPTTIGQYQPQGVQPILTEPKQKESKHPLDIISALPLGDPKRTQLENEYTDRARQASEIDAGLMLVVDKDSRRRLLDRRFQIRQTEKQANLKILNQDRISWARNNGIHEEALGICIDAYPKAKRIIEVLFETKQGDDMMINPGGMAALVRRETDSFIDVGDVPAIKQINLEAFPGDRDSLKTLCRKISKDTGLKFVPENIPGSKRGDTNENLSGGAIGLQFMPSKALAIYELFEKYDLQRNLESDQELHFNPFDPTSSVIGAWVFLAQHEDLGELGERYGYRRGDQEKMLKALMKWNNSKASAAKILEAASDYWNKFVRT